MTSAPPPPRARFAGLDGLRALAVTLVLVYHLFPAGPLRSGFLGVDVFFVISGFLITSLLLRETDTAGRIDLVGFWRRRARRLLPALAVVVTVAASAAWLVGGDVLVRLGRQVAGAATFSYNWLSISAGTDYFTADTPELLRNLWSLAVEEQFYLVWPLLLPLLLLVGRRWARVVIAGVAALSSAAWMGALVIAGAGVTRAYFGTDAHAFGLLLGVALAIGLQTVFAAPPRWLQHPVARIGGLFVGVAAVAALGALALLPQTQNAVTFPGALLAASVVTAVAITCGVLPGSWLGPALDVPPLRWIGDRSYGLYLWHWPLLVLVAALAGTGSARLPLWTGLAVLAMSVVVTELSYRYVERPVRRHGFRGALRMLAARFASTPLVRFRAVTAVAVGVLVLGGTTAAIAVAPAETSGQAAVQAGQRALTEQPVPRPPLLPPSASPTAAPAPTAAVNGTQIDVVGDSVTLASAAALIERYPGIRIDAKVSRSMYAAPGILQALGTNLRRYVVLGLGTNGAVNVESLDQVRATLGAGRDPVLVTASAPRSWIPGVNRTLTEYAASHSDVYLADWAGAIAGHTDLLAGDEIHPGEAGGRIYAATVADAITRAALAQAAERERMLLRIASLTAS